MENNQKINTNMAVAIIVTGIIGLIVGYCLNENSYSRKYMFSGFYDNSKKENQYQERGAISNVSGMHGAMQGMMMGLYGKVGDDLDRAFLEQMIVHHEGAIEMAKVLKSGTKRTELSKLADDIINAQTKEVSMMRGWLSDWFK